jgi:hypothetical protein
MLGVAAWRHLDGKKSPGGMKSLGGMRKAPRFPWELKLKA